MIPLIPFPLRAGVHQLIPTALIGLFFSLFFLVFKNYLFS